MYSYRFEAFRAIAVLLSNQITAILHRIDAVRIGEPLCQWGTPQPECAGDQSLDRLIEDFTPD